jgi:hypothetical protein
MTQAQVDAARKTLEAQGDPVSARKVLKLIRRMPPKVMGGSFRDLLPMLRIPRVISEAERAIRDLDDMTRTCEAALKDKTTAATWPKLIAASEEQWRQGMRLLLRMSARGEGTQALTLSLEQLREARCRLLFAQARWQGLV